MKSLLLFLSVIAAAFTLPNWAREQHSSPMPKVPWYPNENNNPLRATEQATSTPLVQDVFEAGHVYLILGNSNKFLFAAPTFNDQFDIVYYIATTSVQNRQDKFCRFAASTLYNGKVALRNMGVEQYLQLSGNSIEPTVDAITAAAQFEVEVGAPISEWPGAHFVHLKAENGKYWGISQDEIIATFDTTEQATRLIVLDAR